jgi:hypothetical protein
VDGYCIGNLPHLVVRRGDGPKSWGHGRGKVVVVVVVDGNKRFGEGYNGRPLEEWKMMQKERGSGDSVL